jgi:hypothetical protein
VAERPYDHILIEALANGATQRAAARAAKVSESTVYRRLEDRDFCLRRENRRDQLRRLEEMKRLEYVFAGADALLDVARNSDHDMARVQAAGQLLDLIPRLPVPTPPRRPAPAQPNGPSAVEVIKQRLADRQAREASVGCVEDSTDLPEAQK